MYIKPCTHIRPCTAIYIHVDACAPIDTHIQPDTSMYMQIQMHPCRDPELHPCVHPCLHPYVWACLHMGGSADTLSSGSRTPACTPKTERGLDEPRAPQSDPTAEFLCLAAPRHWRRRGVEVLGRGERHRAARAPRRVSLSGGEMGLRLAASGVELTPSRRQIDTESTPNRPQVDLTRHRIDAESTPSRPEVDPTSAPSRHRIDAEATPDRARIDHNRLGVDPESTQR